MIHQLLLAVCQSVPGKDTEPQIAPDCSQCVNVFKCYFRWHLEPLPLCMNLGEWVNVM